MTSIARSAPTGGGNPPKAPATAASSKKARTTAAPAVTPLAQDSRMTVHKHVIDELLLVCGVIGTSTDQAGRLVPVTDCLNWLQDLQRAVRRDDELYRPISLQLGKWKVVQQKLLPLAVTCRYDTPMVLTIVKILVILTKPLSENTIRAGRMVIDTQTKKHSERYVHNIVSYRCIPGC